MTLSEQCNYDDHFSCTGCACGCHTVRPEEVDATDLQPGDVIATPAGPSMIVDITDTAGALRIRTEFATVTVAPQALVELVRPA